MPRAPIQLQHVDPSIAQGRATQISGAGGWQLFTVVWPNTTQEIDIVKVPRPSVWDRLVTDDPFRWGDYGFIMEGVLGYKPELEQAVETGQRERCRVGVPTVRVSGAAAGGPSTFQPPIYQVGDLVVYKDAMWMIVEVIEPERHSYVEPSEKQLKADASREACARHRKEQRKFRPKHDGPAGFTNRPIVGFKHRRR